MTSRVRIAKVFVTGVAFATIGACSSGPTRTPKVPEVFDLDSDAATGIADVDPNRGAVVAADELRLLLERQMSWHGITLVEAMRGAANGEAGSDEWTEALVGNTNDLTQAVGLVYGPAGARAFHQLWAQHTQFLIDYAAAAGRGDRPAMAQARENLDDYVTDSGSFFDTATAGGLPAATAREVLHTHVEHMIEQLDADVAKDDATALDVALDDHGYLVGVADALSGAIAGQQPVAFPGDIATDHADQVSATNEAAGVMVITALGSRRPLSEATWPTPFRALSADARDANGWIEATDDLDVAVRDHDHAAMVTSSRATLSAADALSRLLAAAPPER